MDIVKALTCTDVLLHAWQVACCIPCVVAVLTLHKQTSERKQATQKEEGEERGGAEGGKGSYPSQVTTKEKLLAKQSTCAVVPAQLVHELAAQQLSSAQSLLSAGAQLPS